MSWSDGLVTHVTAWVALNLCRVLADCMSNDNVGCARDDRVLLGFCHFILSLFDCTCHCRITIVPMCRQLTLANSLIVATRLILSIPQLRYSNLARESRYHPKTRKDHTKHSSMASQPAHTNDDKVKRRSTRRAGAAQHI